ncbi:unnamed protein product [Tenebrio molitor]|jgi:hypothetical protein|nr:unnamed protein product [Tenebrio molitor]
MELKKLVIFLLVSVSTSLGQEAEEPTGDYLVQLKFSLREERVPSIVNYLLNNSLEMHDIQTADIIKLSKLDRYDLGEIREAFNYYNITLQEAFTVDSLENLLSSLDIEFVEFYRNLTAKLDVSTELGKVLDDLSIPVYDFSMAILNNDYVYDTLRKGIYDEAHVNQALATVGKTGSEVYAAARDLVVRKTLELSASDFMEILKENGWSRHSSLELYKALNVTTRDIYEVEKFRSIFENITDTLNKNLTLGVFTGPKQLAVHEAVYNQSFNHVDGITLKIEANGLEVNLKKESNLGERIVEMTTVQAGQDHIEITESYNTTDSCSYLTIVDGKVSVERVEVVDFTVEKTDRTQFYLGSPLVCGGRLYGLAREEDSTGITFDIFYNEDNPQIEVNPPESGADSPYPRLLTTLALNMFVSLLLL